MFKSTVFVGLLTTLLFVVSVLAPRSVEAQFSLGGNTSAALAVRPSFPAPHTEATVELDAYAMELAGASIRWYVDGVEQLEARNARSLTFATGKLGTNHALRAVIISSNGAQTEAALKIPITALDLILESDTYVPSFYKGRALPSAGATVRAVALLHTGGNVRYADYVYEWKLDGAALFGGPVLGKYQAEIEVPQYADHRLSATVYDRRGKALGSRSIEFSGVEPEVYFYEENPLRGMSRRAIGQEFTLIGDETTVFAEPYYMSTPFGDPKNILEWRLNGQKVSASNAAGNALTLKRTGGEGVAGIDFRYTVTSIPMQSVSGNFDIFYR